MWYVRINDECPTDVRFRFSDAKEHLVDIALEINDYDVVSLIDKFEDIISKFIQINPKFKDRVDILEDYYYYITCVSEEEAERLEEQLNEQCELVWEQIEEEIEEYYEEYYEEEEEEEIII